jgi:hypothetical protein
LQVISLADDSKVDLLKFTEQNPVFFPVLYNAKILGDGPYAGELGYPRMFFIDKTGIIRKVLPQEAFEQGKDNFTVLEKLLISLR